MYNGHKNWNHWNVALWIGNDPGLYALAKECLRTEPNRARAARAFMDALEADAPDWTKPHTCDGAPFTVTSVRAAMRDLS